MSDFEKILLEAHRASQEDDLPDELLNKIVYIADNRHKYENELELLEELLERLEDYEPFADVGCGNESYSTADIQRTVDKIIS